MTVDFSGESLFFSFLSNVSAFSKLKTFIYISVKLSSIRVAVPVLIVIILENLTGDGLLIRLVSDIPAMNSMTATPSQSLLLKTVDTIDVDGSIYDLDCMKYLAKHVVALREAIVKE